MSFGVTGVKRLFCQNCNNLPKLYSLTIRIMHIYIHQLQILYLYIYAIGSWVTRGYHLGHSTIGQGSLLAASNMSKLLFKSSLVTRNMIFVT